MMNLKKVIATLVAAMILTTGTVSVASAGGIFDCIKSLCSTAVSGLETVGNAVVGAGKYVFTDADGEESFADMKKSASETGDSFLKMGENAVQAAKDIHDFQVGSYEMIAGAIATGATAVAETAVNVATGSDDYTWTKTTAGVMKDGYDKYDAGWETAADIATLAGPAGALAVNGMRVVKKAGEAAVGYKDVEWKDVGKAVEDGVINSVITVATAGVGSLATEAASSTTAFVASTATKAAMKTAYDLADPNNERDAVTTILEDVSSTAILSGIGTSVKTLAQ